MIALAAAAALVAPANAAPISGSFTVDLVFAPICQVPWDRPAATCAKVSDTVMKLEVDLVLRLTISGLEIGSNTVFTFKGVEFQSFTLSTTIGALTVRDTFVFAPSIWEIEIQRTGNTLSARYCINAQSPGDVTPPFLDCPAPDGFLFFLIEDVGVFHPALQNFILAQIADKGGMLDAILVFRKKVVELSLNIAGLTISTRALFSNVGTATAPKYNTGVVAAIEGQTVSGVTVRAESWLGARQGLECFAECKPLQRVYGGKTISNFTIQEEKLFIRNLTIAGVTFNIRAEFQLFNNPGAADCPVSGLCFVQIDSRARVAPLNLTVSNTLRLDFNLNPRFDVLQTSLKFGDVSVIAVWLFYLRQTNSCGFGLPCPWEAQLAEFVSTFDPPGVTVTSDLLLCTERLFVSGSVCAGGGLNGVAEHDVYISAAVGNFTFDAKAVFFGLLTGFSELDIDVAWKAGNVDFSFSVVLSTDALLVARLRTSIKF
ncbi:hypothetical protein HYR54_13190 [Candidatus Acetothermia bacterium]|nr:hypothetical protein [Candidatus Acetothermia bacterium]